MAYTVLDDLELGGATLIVVAHADDAEVRAGGVVAQLAGRGLPVYYALCTDGSKGSTNGPVEVAALVQARQREQLAAAEQLGVREVFFLGYPDGELENTLALRSDLVKLIRKLRPELIVTHDPWALYQLHPDHRAAGFATCDAAMAAGNPLHYSQMVQSGLEPHQVEQIWLMASTAPNVFVNTQAVIEKKLNALACHVSQNGHSSWIQQKVRERERQAGALVKVPFAEPYRRIALGGGQ